VAFHGDDLELMSELVAAARYPYGAQGQAALRLEAIIAESAALEPAVFSGVTAPVPQPADFEADDD